MVHLCCEQNHGRPLLSFSFFDAVDPGEEEDDEDDEQQEQQQAKRAATQKGKGGNGGDGDDGATAARVNVWSLSDPAYRSLLREVLGRDG